MSTIPSSPKVKWHVKNCTDSVPPQDSSHWSLKILQTSFQILPSSLITNHLTIPSHVASGIKRIVKGTKNKQEECVPKLQYRGLLSRWNKASSTPAEVQDMQTVMVKKRYHTGLGEGKCTDTWETVVGSAGTHGTVPSALSQTSQAWNSFKYSVRTSQ
jgi:hypothetical protein